MAANQTATEGDLLAGFTRRSASENGRPPSRVKAWVLHAADLSAAMMSASSTQTHAFGNVAFIQ